MNIKHYNYPLNNVQKFFIVLSILTFIISLTQPAFYIDRKDYDAWADSKTLFLLGWSGIVGGSTESLLWWANPVYLAAMYFFVKNNEIAVTLSLISSYMSYYFSTFKEILTSESGATSKITSFELGYKLWLASMVILFIGTLVNLLTKIIARKNF